MNFIPAILNTLRGTVLTVSLILAGSSCFAQSFTIMNMRPVPVAEASAPTFGEFVTGGEMPAPVWRDENGKLVARLVMKSGTAAAWMLNFRTLNLPEGAQMYLYGSDAAGNRQSVHGPYEGHGPLNVPDFATELIAGNTLTIEIRGAAVASAEWPFAIDSVEQIGAARLTELRQNGAELLIEVKPRIRKVNPNPDIRSAYVGDRLVKYEVVDGKAVFEGDIVLGKAEEMGSFSAKKANGQKEGHITTVDPVQGYWASGTVAYQIRRTGLWKITPGSTMDTRIVAAVAAWNTAFPGIITQRTTETAYVTFEMASGVCRSETAGRTGSEQLVEVDTICGTGNLIHEIGHVLGLNHEHTRPDRDSFVTINWSNIASDKTSQFDIPPTGESAVSGSYDFGSIMHYPVNAFSSNGNNTMSILATVPTGVIVGQGAALSVGDRNTIRRLYCSNVTTKGPATIELDSEAGGGDFTFTMPGYCTWTITQQAASWLKVTSTKTTGTAGGSVTFTVTENTGKYGRSASIYYGGRSTVIRQAGVGIFGKQF